MQQLHHRTPAGVTQPPGFFKVLHNRQGQQRDGKLPDPLRNIQKKGVIILRVGIRDIFHGFQSPTPQDVTSPPSCLRLLSVTAAAASSDFITASGKQKQKQKEEDRDNDPRLPDFQLHEKIKNNNNGPVAAAPPAARQRPGRPLTGRRGGTERLRALA